MNVGCRRAAALALVSVAVIPWARAADTSRVVEVGWWTRSPLAAAPAGGVVVGAGPDAPTSVAAVRIDVGDGVASATVELPLVQGFAEAAAKPQVCVVDGPWVAVAAGSLADAPATTCPVDATVSLAQAAADAPWSADVSSLLAGRTGVVSLLLAPTEVAVDPLGGAVPWELRLGPPVLQTRPFAPDDPGDPPVSDPGPGPGVTFDVDPFVPLPPVAGVTPSTTTIPAPAPTEASPVVASAPLPYTGPLGRPLAQALLFLLVAALAGVAVGGGHFLVAKNRG